jgi:acyl-coenzyme A synthetase/AMP-(fatty) acid ligase
MKPAAYVVLKAGKAGDEPLREQIRQHMVSRLAAHKCPQILEFVKDLPKTATGKIQRYKLREAAEFQK